MEYICDNCGKDIKVTVYYNRKGKKRVTWHCNNCGATGYEDYQEDVKNEKTEK